VNYILYIPFGILKLGTRKGENVFGSLEFGCSRFWTLRISGAGAPAFERIYSVSQLQVVMWILALIF